MKIAIIPARGGSKRIPRKNIREFCGKPIIAWSIEAALGSTCFDRVIVPTDDQEIFEVAAASGAEVPFVRPEEVSNDHASTIAVIDHTIDWLKSCGQTPRLACCIDATAPFVTAADLQRGLQVLEEFGAEYAFSVTSYPLTIQRVIRLNRNGRVGMFQPEHFATRSQDLEEAFHDAGQFYWGRVDAFARELPVFSDAASALVLPRYRMQDIDTLEDWKRADLLLALQQHEGAPRQ